MSKNKNNQAIWKERISKDTSLIFKKFDVLKKILNQKKA